MAPVKGVSAFLSLGRSAPAAIVPALLFPSQHPCAPLLLLPRPCCLLRVLRYTRSEKKDVARFRIVLKLGLALNIPVDDTELVNVGLLRIAGLVARHALVAHSIIISIFTFILTKPT